MPYLGRPGMPLNPNLRLGNPGMGAIVPPGRTTPTPGLPVPAQPQPNEPADE
jgi:hypothetical protein